MVTFYKLKEDGSVGEPVLFLDTLKVSTIEQTASQVDARGGKGNPKLITWDYGKEITVNITDALFSPKSMSILYSDGTVTKNNSDVIDRTVVGRIGSDSKLSEIVVDVYDSEKKGAVRKKIDLANDTNARTGYIALSTALLTPYALYDERGNLLTSESGPNGISRATLNAFGSYVAGEKVFIKYKQNVTSKTLVITGDSFPGTYYVTGDTYARSDVTGADEFFQFVIPKAKMSAQNTITLEAEGDPTTFNMNLTVLRPEDGEMMKLIQYSLNGNG